MTLEEWRAELRGKIPPLLQETPATRDAYLAHLDRLLLTADELTKAVEAADWVWVIRCAALLQQTEYRLQLLVAESKQGMIWG